MPKSHEHYKFMKIALEYGETALKANEVPVSAILVSNLNNEILFKSHNLTNKTLNGTLHAEFIIYNHLLQKYPTTHLDIWKNSTLYVTVEPCIMCASMLDQIGLNTVVFGCANERFGGNGSVFNIRYKSNYRIIPGVCLKDAVMLLRRFYINENDQSPTGINKKKRVLKFDNFPTLEYSKFIPVEEFVDAWGTEHKDIYLNNDFLEFNEDGILEPRKSNDIKRLKV